MIDVKKTKTSILSIAFKGALVNFGDKNKNNSELEKIHASNKKYVPVMENEYLIDAPAYWNWTRLGYVVSNHGQTTPTETFSYIDVGTLDNVHQRLSKIENIIEAKDAPSRAKKIVEMDDVLYSTVRPYLHNVCIVDKHFSKRPIASTAFCVMHANKKVLNNKYLFYWLLSPEFDKFSNGNHSKGALYPAIGEKDLLNGVIPLPSLKEQEEIVERIEEAFVALEHIEIAQNSYVTDIEILESKLIDAGIQGKLTEQLPEDGTAQDLYISIQEEKSKLIKEKKIKKEKPIDDITEDEIPFEIPENWKWVRMSEILDVRDGTHDSPQYYDVGIPMITSKNLVSGVLEFEDVKYVSEEDAKKINERSAVQDGDILFAMIGTIGNPVLVKKDREFVVKNVALFKKYGNTKLSMEYIYWYLMREQNEFKKIVSGGLQPFISLKQFREHVMPLPPYEEQKRIVNRLETLFESM